MSYLTKIIIKEWFKSLLAALIVLILITATAELINGFLRNKGSISIIFYDFILKAPALMSKMLPISTLLATLFSFNKLKSHSELIAILAASYSPKKIYFIITMASLSVASFQFYNTSYLQPIANKAKIQQSNTTGIQSKMSEGKIWYKSKDYFSSFTAFDNKTQTLYDLTLFFHNSEYKGSNIIYGKEVKFLKDNKWIIKKGKVYKTLDLDRFQSSQIIKNYVITLDESKSDFKKFESDISTFTFFALSNYIERLKNTGINTSSYSILFLEKISLSLICIIFALFPLSTIFQPNRRSASFGKNVVFTLVFTVTYWLIYTSLIALGNKETVSPFVSTMLIPILFIVYITLIFYKNKKLN
ncbi:MAG: lipopolysaccharide export system permease protein [Thermoproteota archaeon]|jgi:lipopolysaccharide export system permease protein